MKRKLEIDHIGYAVKDIAQAIPLFAALGFEFMPDTSDSVRNVKVCLGSSGGVKVELCAPVGDTKSPVDGILAKNGATPYHICYRVSDIQETMERLRDSGFMPLGEPAESEPLGGIVCFMFSAQAGIIELIEYRQQNKNQDL